MKILRIGKTLKRFCWLTRSLYLWLLDSDRRVFLDKKFHWCDLKGLGCRDPCSNRAVSIPWSAPSFLCFDPANDYWWQKSSTSDDLQIQFKHQSAHMNPSMLKKLRFLSKNWWWSVCAPAISLGQKWRRAWASHKHSCNQWGEAACTQRARFFVFLGKMGLLDFSCSHNVLTFFTSSSHWISSMFSIAPHFFLSFTLVTYIWAQRRRSQHIYFRISQSLILFYIF